MKIVKGSNLSKFYLQRNGVMPYTIDEKGRIFFLLGVDKDSLQYTDFGGAAKRDENSLLGALREFSQETRMIFAEHLHYSVNKTENCVAMVNQHQQMSILFVPVSRYWLAHARAKFSDSFASNKMQSRHFLEILHVEWIESKKLQQIIKMSYGKLYGVTWKMLSNFLHGNIDDKLLNLLKFVYRFV